MQAHDQLVQCLSALQLESVVYACQRHEQMLPDGSRGGFFIGGRARSCAGSLAALPRNCQFVGGGGVRVGGWGAIVNVGGRVGGRAVRVGVCWAVWQQGQAVGQRSRGRKLEPRL